MGAVAEFSRELDQFLAVADTENEVIQFLLRKFCELLNCQHGGYWKFNAFKQELHFDQYYSTDIVRFGSFADNTKQVIFRSGLGLPGRVLKDGKAHWIDIFGEYNFPRKPFAMKCGLVAGMAFPITVSGQVTGVIEVFSTHPLAKNEALAAELSGMAGRIGHVLKRISLPQMVETAKMISLGQLAGGVSHEVNNPLTIILGKVDQLRIEIDEGTVTNEKLLSGLKVVEECALRIRNVVKGLKTLSGGSDSDSKEEISVQKILNDTLELCRERFRSDGIELRSSGQKDLSIYCHRVQIAQALMNVLNNAHDAVMKLEERWIQIEVRDAGDNIQLVVTDSGPGITTQVSEKMMLPFYTTKEVNRGLGLGLTIANTFVTEDGGHLYYNPSSAHTQFVVELPKKKDVKS